ncbi:MAG: DUF6677 family protein [Planctomycetota bacterium]|jgi:hypothetical protein
MKTGERSNLDQGIWLIVVGLAAWIIPGAGHFLIRQPKRAVIILVTITTLFLMGLYIGSIGVVDRVGSWPWFLAQMMCSPAVGIIAKIVQSAPPGTYNTFGRPCDIGQIYTGIAGLLNLLSVISAVYMAYCGRGEFIGAEEEEVEEMPNA